MALICCSLCGSKTNIAWCTARHKQLQWVMVNSVLTGLTKNITGIPWSRVVIWRRDWSPTAAWELGAPPGSPCPRERSHIATGLHLLALWTWAPPCELFYSYIQTTHICKSFISMTSMNNRESRLEIGYTMGHMKLSTKLMVRDDYSLADSLHTCAECLHWVLFLHTRSSLSEHLKYLRCIYLGNTT